MSVWSRCALGSCFLQLRMCHGLYIGCVMVSPNEMTHELLVRLEFACTNNQAEYEALVARMEWLVNLKVRHIEAYGDSQLVVQQIRGESQCLEDTLNCYHDQCMKLIKEFDTFYISHVHRKENRSANDLAQHASEYEGKRGRFVAKRKSVVHDIMNMQDNEGVPAEEKHVKDTPEDWRQRIVNCIKSPDEVKDRKMW
jgi:ribonuclease HI